MNVNIVMPISYFDVIDQMHKIDLQIRKPERRKDKVGIT